jgi:hypothetical protein
MPLHADMMTWSGFRWSISMAKMSESSMTPVFVIFHVSPPSVVL